jgi:hypothetical protein
MAESSLTRRGLFASSLLLAGAVAAGAAAEPVAETVGPATASDDVFLAALSKFDATQAAIDMAPDDDDTTWAGLTDEWTEAADALIEMPSPNLSCFRAKLDRTFKYYRHLDGRISFEHGQMVLDDLARLVPA